jgi:hypothetical protein
MQNQLELATKNPDRSSDIQIEQRRSQERSLRNTEQHHAYKSDVPAEFAIKNQDDPVV